MAIEIGRRHFISALGASLTWPFVARAQQPERIRHIGVLVGLASSADDPVAGEFLRVFHDAMLQAGWREGKNIRIDYRFSGGDRSKTNMAATELVALSPELTYAQGFPATLALHQETKSIPIVFTYVADPVGFGLMESLSHPGGNVTGFIVWDLSIGGKWMQLLRQLVPEVDHVGIIYNPDTAPYAPALIASAKAAAGDMAVVECHIRNDGETETAVSLLSKEPHAGLLVIPEPFTTAHQDQIIALCARFRLPAVTPMLGAAKRGALLSYTANFDDTLRQPVTYIDRILKGELPGDLPIQEPTKFELSINLKTAKAIGLTVSPTLLALADEVIE